MAFRVHILSGRDVTSRAKIEVALRENKKDVPMLETLIKDMESKDSENSDWWLAINEDTQLPNGFISVIYDGTQSYLTHLWTKATSTNELDYTSQALIKEWKKYAMEEAEVLVADLYPQSPLIASFKKMGFEFEKNIMTVYKVPTRFMNNLTENFYLEKVDPRDAEFIYDYLVFPDLDIDSPIYVDKMQFMNLIEQVAGHSESTVVAKDFNGQIIGFGGSFLQGPPNRRFAVLYGPHAFEPEIQYAMINEFLSYWKLKGQNSLRIIRTHPFPPDIVKRYGMKIMPKYTQSRFVCRRLN
ncbi:MAG: hypothetical protein D6732_11410 [Methanobacteriota archaeon]|nr:MAG: hypothetical protein D6732_11410 [Euryarchaeota archaeon]